DRADGSRLAILTLPHINSFEHDLRETAAQVERVLDFAPPPPNGPRARVAEAMRYAAIGPGKRLRPYLVLSSADLFGVQRSCALRVAAGVEMVHCHSRLHHDF